MAATPEEVEALRAENRALKAQLEKSQHTIEIYKSMLFGRSSEKRRPAPGENNPNQGHLFSADLLQEAERTAEQKGVEGSITPQPRKPKKKGGRRKKFPEHLPRARTTYELPEEKRVCSCGSPLHKIGEDVRKELERIELSLVHEIACVKYGCRSCGEKVVTAPGPDRVIDKGILGNSFLSHVLVERFGNHMPYHRLEKKYASEGLDLNRSVLQRSMTKLSQIFTPIYEQLRSEVLASDVIFTDDTPVTIASGSNGKSRTGRTWIYLDREGRHFYDFTESRQRDGPARILADYRGLIHADAYPGYDQLFLPDGATEVGCWAHARRKFIDIESTEPALSKEAVGRIGELYAIEKQLADADDDQRQQVRQEHAVPRLEALRSWIELQSAQVLPRSSAANAIGYVQRQWDALSYYASDGRASIDNNAAERALRPFAVGRKNWLFFQNDNGGTTAVILASLLRTALAAGINPLVYFRDLLMRISTCSDVTKLTPHGWKQHFMADVEAERERLLASVL